MGTNQKNNSEETEKNLDYWKMVNLDTSMYEGSTSMGSWHEADDCGNDD